MASERVQGLDVQSAVAATAETLRARRTRVAGPFERTASSGSERVADASAFSPFEASFVRQSVMERLVVLLVVFAILAVLLVLSRRRARSEQVGSIVYERRHLFGKAERSFLRVLDEAVGDQVRAFGKVRLDDLLQVPAAVPSGVRRDARNATLRRRVDFVLCDPADLRVLAVVELDDSSRAADRAGEHDAIVDAALASAGVPLIRFDGRSAYAAAEVRRRLDPVLAAVPPAMATAGRSKAAKGKPAESRTTPVPTAPTAGASPAGAPAPVPASVTTPATAVAAPAAASVARSQAADGEHNPYARLGTCPTCGRPMVERIGKRGALKGKPYLVCSGDPPCGAVVAAG